MICPVCKETVNKHAFEVSPWSCEDCGAELNVKCPCGKIFQHVEDFKEYAEILKEIEK